MNPLGYFRKASAFSFPLLPRSHLPISIRLLLSQVTGGLGQLGRLLLCVRDFIANVNSQPGFKSSLHLQHLQPRCLGSSHRSVLGGTGASSGRAVLEPCVLAVCLRSAASCPARRRPCQEIVPDWAGRPPPLPRNATWKVSCLQSLICLPGLCHLTASPHSHMVHRDAVG